MKDTLFFFKHHKDYSLLSLISKPNQPPTFNPLKAQRNRVILCAPIGHPGSEI